MGLRKFGSPEKIEPEEDERQQKTAKANFTEEDRKALHEENAAVDKDQ